MTSTDELESLPVYDITKSYDWNYDNPPNPRELEIPTTTSTWDFFGHKISSPLGVSAGPLLNGRWILYYASLGFDILTYKTVRSRERACYPGPNLLPVDCEQLTGMESSVTASDSMKGSWAVSFGMPSKDPSIWRRDVEQTRANLPTSKLLSVSVVGTVQDGWAIGDLAADYAKCAKWAIESGADCVEANYSCPNVLTCDGQLYQQASDARIVSEHIRDAIGNAPFVIKIGHFMNNDDSAKLVETQYDLVNAIATTNSVALAVTDGSGTMLFDGNRRGICGAGTLQASIRQTKVLQSNIEQKNSHVELIGVGGIRNSRDVIGYLQAGASSVQIATAAMLNPKVAIEIRADPSLQQYMLGRHF